MSHEVSRRTFVATGTAVVAVATKVFGQGSAVIRRSPGKPVVVSSANGNRYKNGGNMTCVETAWSLIAQGSDVLDAVIAGVNIVELDPLDDSVGYGGLPNAEGVVQLDSSCMHGPRKRAGAVASIEGVRTPSLVAKAVMDYTDHHLVVGKGAQEFARNMGFTIESDLNTPNSRQKWLEWKRRTDPSHYLDPKTRAEAGYRVALQMVAEGKIYRRILETQVPHPARDAGTPDAGAAGARTAQVRSAPDAGPQEYMYVPGGPLPPGEGTAAATPPDAGQR